MRNKIGTGRVRGRYDRRERYHLTLCVTGVEFGDIDRAGTEFRFRLHDDVPDAGILVELADNRRTELRLQGAGDVVHVQSQQARLVTVDGDFQLL